MLIKGKTRAGKVYSYRILVSFKTSLTYNFFCFTPDNCVCCEAAFVGHSSIFFRCSVLIFRSENANRKYYFGVSKRVNLWKVLSSLLYEFLKRVFTEAAYDSCSVVVAVTRRLFLMSFWWKFEYKTWYLICNTILILINFDTKWA